MKRKAALARKDEIERWLEESKGDLHLFDGNTVWRFRRDLKVVNTEIAKLDSSANPLNVVKKNLKRKSIQLLSKDFIVGHVDQNVCSDNNYIGFDRPKLAEVLGTDSLDYHSHAAQLKPSPSNFWVQAVYKKIKKLHNTSMQDLTYLTRIIELFTMCKSMNLESIWTVFVYQYPKVCAK